MIHFFTKQRSSRCFLASICICLFALPSCTKKFYAPNQVFVPNLTERNDFAVRGDIIAGDYIRGVSAQAAYSPLKGIGIMGSYTNFSSSQEDNFSNGFLWDVSAGTYFNVGRWNCELYGGYGRGFNQQFLGIGSWGNFDLERFHGQASMVLPTKYVHFFVGLRAAGLSFTSGEIIISDNTNDLDKVEFIRQNTPFFLFEPTWGFKFGVPGIYVVMQRTSSFSSLFNNGLSSHMASIGVQISPDLFRSKEKKKPYLEHSF